MPLKDLIITNQKISEDLVENILKGRVELIQEGNKIILTRDTINIANKTKILLFLAGAKAWELLEEINLSYTPTEIGETLNILGNSLRPAMKMLSDNYLVSNNKGKYCITTKGIYELDSLLKDGIQEKSNIKRNHSKKVGQLKTSKNNVLPSKTKAIEELISEGYFSSPKDNTEILNELSRRGVTIKSTSLPSFLLPLIRKKVLKRDYKEKNKGKVWAYKIYND
ncbi:MAG: hypothetical protein PHX34_05955 [Candidatus Shapirobacteria bacterium]|nr:hypothetical protein [Candidatus Shapirobacteria bacterium]